MLTKRNFKRFITFIFIFGAFIFLISNKHSHNRLDWGYLNYRGIIYSDMAGYYVYLPATFNYNYQADLFPDTIDIRTGHGFKLEPETNKVITKYTYGIALLEAPFYLLAQYSAPSLGYPADGFSPPYHWALDVSAAFYITIALGFLFSILSKLYSKKTALLTLFTIVFATNLYYYTVDDSSMSHVYSFFLFSSFLYLLFKTDFLKRTSFISLILLGLIAGMIVLIRPTGILFLTSYFFVNAQSKNELTERFKRLFNTKMLIAVMGAVLVFIPQVLYWHYISGKYIYFSYQNEGFLWLRPVMHLTWFSPNNGLFIYNPIYIFIVIGLIMYAKHYKKLGSYYLILFLVISYVFSCWWSWMFGCAYGARSFVEYLAIFSIPLGLFYKKIIGSKVIKQVTVYLALLIMTAYNIKLIYSYDGCYRCKYGAKWDWELYFEHLASPINNY